jgi:hypothetical protein
MNIESPEMFGEERAIGSGLVPPAADGLKHGKSDRLSSLVQPLFAKTPGVASRGIGADFGVGRKRTLPTENRD